jgi:cytochrome c biogenesis protein CcmG, thiol:disulfide interchange protein DsbE
MIKGVATLILMVLVFAAGAAEAKGPRIGEAIPSQQLLNMAGRTVDTARYDGKVVVLYFWTDACGCKEQLLELRSVIMGLKNRPLAFLAVNAGQEREKIQRFIAENNVPYEVLLDEKGGSARNQLGVKVLPTIFVISKDRVLREKLIGVVDTKKLEKIISSYL